jgi:hypothetical protein
MAKRLWSWVIPAGILCVGVVGFLLFVHSEPSTVSLDQDLSTIRTQIQLAEADDRRYEGGLLKAVIGLRREVLQLTEAMLSQKRTSFIRRIDLRYIVNGVPASSLNPEELKRLESDIKIANEKLARDQSEASRYSGGLVQALSLTTVETDKLNLAQLELAYYNRKYGLSLPLQFKQGNAETPPQAGNPGHAVTDRDALH